MAALHEFRFQPAFLRPSGHNETREYHILAYLENSSFAHRNAWCEVLLASVVRIPFEGFSPFTSATCHFISILQPSLHQLTLPSLARHTDSKHPAIRPCRLPISRFRGLLRICWSPPAFFGSGNLSCRAQHWVQSLLRQQDTKHRNPYSATFSSGFLWCQSESVDAGVHTAGVRLCQ